MASIKMRTFDECRRPQRAQLTEQTYAVTRNHGVDGIHPSANSAVANNRCNLGWLQGLVLSESSYKGFIKDLRGIF